MTFTLQILHASDLEGGLDAIENAPNFAVIVDALETEAEAGGYASITLSAGDNYIPGPFFNAGGDSSLAPTYEGFYNKLFGLIDTSLLSDAEDTNGDGFFDNDEIEAAIRAGIVTFDQVYTTDVNGDGFADYFEEIDTSEGRIDIAVTNAIGFDASAVGNHEFDAGTDIFENAINYDSEEGNSLSTSRFADDSDGQTPIVPNHINFLQEVDTPGAQFPYLSANLDFSGSSDLGSLFTSQILPNTDFQSDLSSARDDLNDPAFRGSDSNDDKIVQATIIDADGEPVGVVGATTQLVQQISSTGPVADVSSPGVEDMQALADVLQPVIDDLIATGLNKVILVSHLQKFALEQELAGLLSGVDVIIAGGSDTLNADEQDRLRPGDEADQPYPFLTTNADGDPLAIVSTDGEYSYVGRLVLDFDEDGKLIESSIDENVSGAFATDDQGVLDVTGEATIEDAIAASDVASDVENLTQQVTDIVIAVDSDIVGEASVYLNGERADVRTQETNLGNLTADANLAAAQDIDPDVVVSIKNGGGIRAPIGSIDGLTGERDITEANPLSDKEAGQISELDLDNALRFDNGLVLVDLTPQELLQILEHAVSATEPGATPGQFPQVGGLAFSFDPTAQAQVLDGGTPTTEGERIQSVALIDDDGRPYKTIIENGEVVDGAPENIKVVTLSFLAAPFRGDGYPFVDYSEVTDLGIGEQEALSTFLRTNFPEDGDTAFSVADTDIASDTRIQNLSERSDTVLSTILDVAASNDAFDILELALLATGLDAVVGDASADLTVFAPTDDAFIALAGDLGIDTSGLDDAGVASAILVALEELLGSPEAALETLSDILLYHVSAGAKTLSEIQMAGNVDTELTDASFTVDGTTLEDADPELTDPEFVDGLTDIGAINGFVQVIDRVLIPQDLPLFTPSAPEPSNDLTAVIFGEYDSGVGGDGAEVVAHEDGILYVTNGESDTIDVFEIASPGAPVDQIDLTTLEDYAGVQSVAVKNGLIAVAVARDPETETSFGEEAFLAQPGFIAFYDTATLTLQSTVDVGNLPDQIVFTDDGQTLLVAGEGEFNQDSIDDGIDVNPLGTVGVVDTSDPTAPVAQILDFNQFNGFEDFAREAGIRLLEGETFAADLEPEYIAISPDGTTAFISLQENNAIIKLDLETMEFSEPFSLGTVDFSDPGEKIDANDNGLIEIRNFDNLVGLRMADSIASYEVDGKTYVVTANEGDSRDFDEDRVEDLFEDGKLDESIDITGLERLEVSTIDGDTDGDGDIDVLHTFSSRSFTIFDEDGNLVFDSGDDFESIIAEIAPERFNDDDGGPDENRSDAKGPEPEAIEIGIVGDKVYAFIGLERDSGIMIYDVTDPANSFFVTYIEPLHVDNAAEGEIARHAPEIIEFIAAEDSLSGNAQIAVSYEVSGTTIVYDLVADSSSSSTKIYDIQGAGHISAFVGQSVVTTGIVTAIEDRGFYVQDPDGDGDDSTSDGIFVFTNDAPTVAVGDEVRLSGEVSEFIPGGADTGNLSTTQIFQPDVEILSSGNALPEAVLLGSAGRTPPKDVVISDDELPVNLQDDPGTFNPETDGIDFYESLEGMLVEVDNPVAISATNRFGETWVVADEGANVTGPDNGLNERGGLTINADADGYGDLNTERIQIQFDDETQPADFVEFDMNVGDALSNVTGVVDYGFGNFEIRVTEAFEVETPTDNIKETTSITSGEETLTVATYNVLNLSAGDENDTAQFEALAGEIATNLGSPDIVALQEIQDDSGTEDDGTLTAEETLAQLVEAIAAAGGPNYEFVSAVVDEDGENGGVPGGNIRNAFLYNPDRVDLKEATTLESDVLAEFGVTNSDAFEGSRDPLLGVFEFNGEEVTLINNHFSSRFGSEPVFGGPQAFFQAAEDERAAQSQAMNELVDALLAEDPDAKISVLGDLNTFEFTDELAEILPGVGDEQVLTNLFEIAEGDANYTFNFQGNSQALDHIFVTDSLLESAQVDVVHVNVDFAGATSDHEPIVASFDFGMSFDISDLEEGQAVDEADINGIDPQSFLTGNGTTVYSVEITGGQAGFKNGLGVYEVNASGQIVDTQMLFANVKAATGPIILDSVEEGNSLGFFLVQNGARALDDLTDTDTFVFLDDRGNQATVNDGNDLFLAINGLDAGLTEFHSFDEALNKDLAIHALSTFDEASGVMTIAMEDKTRLGDTDFNDVIFTVTALEGNAIL